MDIPHVTALLIVTLSGAIGGILFGYRKAGLVWPHREPEKKSVQLGFLGDSVFGAAGAVVIFLIVPAELNLKSAGELIRVLALSLVGGYGGPAVLDRALSMTIRELAKKTGELTDRTETVESRLAAEDQQRLADVNALALVDRQSEIDAPEVPESELTKAVQEASESVRNIIFERAHSLRRSTWRDNKAAMARTIRIFRALVEADKAHAHHRYHAQLGYALKDQQNPDLTEARAALNRAISIRDKGEDRDWYPFYEFNRAICAIGLDNRENPDRPSDEEKRQAIIEDLEVAAPHLHMPKIVREKAVRTWLERNSLEPSELGA